MIFVDINTFYGPKAGGIRTYHQAKIAWFGKQRDHVYCLIFPGPVYHVEKPFPSVWLVQVYGPGLTSDPQGYRLILDYRRVAQWIRKLRPQVVEAGDAWLTSWFCLLLRPLRLWQGLVVSFYHSDPIPSYVMPWSRRGSGQRLRRVAARLAGALFYAVQRRFDCTAVASEAMQVSLRHRGVCHVCRLPFGVPSAFFQASSGPEPLRRRGIPSLSFVSPSFASPPLPPTRLLYAGRLDFDKGADLLLENLTRLLAQEDFFLTVAGRGALSARFAEFRHPRYRYLGFVSGADSMAELYGSHDIFLAPGPFETFGLGVLEAMAAGLIVVGPDAGGTGELLREVAVSSYAFAAGDAEGFLAAVDAAAKADLPAVSERHREVARRYGTWDAAVERMVTTWKEKAQC